MADEEIVTARSDRGGESEASLGDASLIDFDETKGLTNNARKYRTGCKRRSG